MPADAVIHIIDDDDAVRESLAFLLGTAGFTTETYESGEVFLAELPRIDGGCVITDVRMPGMSGIDLLGRLKEMPSNLSVIVVTGHGDVALAVRAMKLGATDFLEKPFDEESLVAAVRDACARLQQRGTETTRRVEAAERLASLSQRERQVLDGLVAGLPNKTIAYDLGISPRTVEVYRANLMTKMRANSLSDVVRTALLGGVLDDA